MATVLRKVLLIFENAKGPLSLTEVARTLDIEPGMLEGMLQYWVRKGKLREVAGGALICPICNKADDCALMPDMPRRFELVGEDTPDFQVKPPTVCCG